MAARITHQDIADHLGISRVSVTQALHGTRRSTLSPELQARILEAARRLNYKPRNVATYAIGLVGDIRSWALAGESQFLVDLDFALRDVGYRVLLASVQDGDLQSVRDILTPKTVDGVIFTRWYNGEAQNILPPEIPWILTSDEDGVPDSVDQITMDTKATASRVTQHLLDHGHERIALVTGHGDRHYHGHIKTGMREAIESNGRPWSSVKVLEVQHDRELKPVFTDLMKAQDGPTAFVTISAEKTIAVLNMLCVAGYKVPEDVSVISIPDSPMFEPLTPSITVTTAGNSRVQAAADRLLEKIRDPLSPPKRVLIPGDIIERESVARVKARR